MNTTTTPIHWSENIIIADADFVDKVAFNLIVNFERMLGRRIPQADFSQWAVDIALDGRLRPGDEHETQVVLLHDKSHSRMENFKPSDYATELNAKAFKDANLGEFIVNSIATGGPSGDSTSVMLDLLHTILNHDEVKRIMVIPSDDDFTYKTLRNALRDADEEKHITLFAMQPLEGGNFRQEILGYSLMNALGIRADELK